VKKSRKPRSRPARPPEQIRAHIQRLIQDHQQAWSEELYCDQPDWEFILGLHLHLIELERLEPAAQELL
jgi:hypothetical protein